MLQGVEGTEVAGWELAGEADEAAVQVTLQRAIPDAVNLTFELFRPQEFTVDGQDGIGNPIGFLGMRLEAAVHVVTSPITARQNVITSVNRDERVMRNSGGSTPRRDSDT